VAEFLDPSVWPPTPRPVPDVVISPVGTLLATSRADQACSGFDGVAPLLQGITLEAGGVVLDPTGSIATIDQDFVLYQFQPATASSIANFAPYTSGAPDILDAGPAGEIDAGPEVLGAALAEPRARAKAAAMIVTSAAGGGGDGGASSATLEDAVLVTGGITCNPTSTLAPCAPAFADGGTGGQLANAPYTYFFNSPTSGADGGDVGASTELIPISQSVNAGTLTADMEVERIDHCAVALPDGRVVILGGLSGSDASSFGTTNSAEVFSDDPTAETLPSVQSTPVPNGLLQARAGMACTLLRDGSILVTGGIQTTGPLSGNQQPVTTLDSAEIFRPLPVAP
jgi:hypothetical protein